MKESESFNGEEKSVLESIYFPTFSIKSPNGLITQKIKNHKKYDIDEEEEDFTFFKKNNNNHIENENDGATHDLSPEIESIHISQSDKDLCKFKEKKKEKKIIKFGRKRKNSLEKGKHNKYSGDNLFRKCKGIILHSLYLLINKIITDIYKYDPNYDKNKIKLLKINQNQIINSDVIFNKQFINKKLKDIFSDKITSRCSRYNPDHNEILINKLLNEEDQVKKDLFEKIFNLTFLDCLNHFRGTKTVKELNDLTTYEEICKNFENDEDYLYSFKYYIDNYETIIGNKKWRKKKNKNII